MQPTDAASRRRLTSGEAIAVNRLLIGSGHVRRLLHRGPRTERELAALAETSDPAVHRLACSLRRAVDDAFSDGVRERFAEIEAIRDRYTQQTLDLDVPATGAQLRRWAKRGSNRKRWGRLLYALVDGMEPETCVEFGGLIGISGAYQALALERAGRGRFTTIEQQEAGVQLARRHFEELSLSDHAQVLEGDFFDRMPEVKSQQPIDYVFIDGAHTIDQTLRLFHELLPTLDDPSLLVFDDITWSKGMRKVWQLLQRHPRTHLAVDLFNIGVLLVGDTDRSTTETYTIALP